MLRLESNIVKSPYREIMDVYFENNNDTKWDKCKAFGFKSDGTNKL